MSIGTNPTDNIFHPDIQDLPEKKGLFCFMNPNRICGADCMAFQLTRPEGQDYVAQQWAQCSILVNMHKVGKHSAIIATELVRSNRDAARRDQQAPSIPMIPKRPGT